MAAQGLRVSLVKQPRNNRSLSSPFLFLDLPYDVREIIYDMVFLDPKIRMFASHRSRKDKKTGTWIENVGVQIVDKRTTFAWEHLPYATYRVTTNTFNRARTFRDARLFPTKSMEKMVSLAFVNRQIYEEVKYRFYSRSRFYCESLRMLHAFLKDMPEAAQNHIGEIAVRYHVGEGPVARAVFERVGQLKNLRKLYIRLKEAAYYSQDNYYKKYQSMASLDGLAAMRRIRVEEAHFHSCPILEEMVKDTMEGKLIGKKRKAVESGDQEHAEGKRAKITATDAKAATQLII